jgi:O-antigen/teichoic acid export membrane protein
MSDNVRRAIFLRVAAIIALLLFVIGLWELWIAWSLHKLFVAFLIFGQIWLARRWWKDDATDIVP